MDENQTAKEKERDALLDPARIAIVEELGTVAAVQEERAIVGYIGSVKKARSRKLGTREREACQQNASTMRGVLARTHSWVRRRSTWRGDRRSELVPYRRISRGDTARAYTIHVSSTHLVLCHNRRQRPELAQDCVELAGGRCRVLYGLLVH